MASQGTPPFKDLYRLPFSKNDNPNGWIEITTHCTMRCPGCYRGCDRPDHAPGHLPVSEVKRQVFKLRQLRNCHMISISGGEPLTHPDLDEIISFINDQGLNPIILTNGTLLTPERLVGLKRAGLIGLYIRIDSLRENKEVTKKELVDKRDYFATMCEKAKISFGMTTVVDKSNQSEIPAIIKWARKHSSQVDQLLFTLKRHVVFDPETVQETDYMTSVSELVDIIKSEIPDIRFNSFLGSEIEDQSIKWLQASWLSLDGKVLGYLDAKAMELMQTLYHYTKGTYCGIVKKSQHRFPLHVLVLFGLLNKSARKSLFKYCAHLLLKPWLLFSPPKVQGMVIINPPYFIEGKRDLCDGCPDAILFNDKLVPSCLLEEIKRYGKLYSIEY